MTAQRVGARWMVIGAVDRVNWGIGYLIALALAIMAVCTFLQVVVRFVLPKIGLVVSVPWTEEVARYLMIWTVFLGAAIGVRRGQLIALEFFVRSLPDAFTRVVRAAVTVLCLSFFVMLIWVGVRFTSWGLTEYSPVMTIPKAWVYASLPASAVLMIANTLAFALAGGERPDESLTPGESVAPVWNE